MASRKRRSGDRRGLVDALGDLLDALFQWFGR